jgi:hypothetical protein
MRRIRRDGGKQIRLGPVSSPGAHLRGCRSSGSPCPRTCRCGHASPPARWAGHTPRQGQGRGQTPAHAAQTRLQAEEAQGVCAGTCGLVKNRQTCGKSVDCGSCACDHPALSASPAGGTAIPPARARPTPVLPAERRRPARMASSSPRAWSWAAGTPLVSRACRDTTKARSAPESPPLLCTAVARSSPTAAGSR